MSLFRKELTRSVKKAFSLTEDTATHDEIKSRILSGGQVTGTNMCVLICAILIASVGLDTGSVAVIIGAMLISPLMGSILAMAYSVAAADSSRFRRHLYGFILQVGISIVVSMVYFLLSPIADASTEILKRTQPSFYDVIIATAGGFAGIIGSTRKDKVTNIIPGVAIATALMPPVCVCGYSIAHMKWQMLAGAGYLFIVNCYFIFMSAVLILDILKIPKVSAVSDYQWRRLKKRMIRNTIIVLLPCALFTYLMLTN